MVSRDDPNHPIKDPSHAWEHPPRLLTEDQARDRRIVARRIKQKLKLATEFRDFTYDDLAIILVNPKNFKAKNMRPKTIVDNFRRHRVLSELFLQYPLKGVVQEPTPPRTRSPAPADKKPRRSSNAKNAAKFRDLVRCIAMGTSHPEMAHIFPWAATNTKEAWWKTVECFYILQMWFGMDFHDKVAPAGLAAFEFAANLLALNHQLHGWLDKGFLAFIPRRMYEVAGEYYIEIVLMWLPACRPQTNQTEVILDEGPDDSVDHIFNQLEAAFVNEYPARRPAEGQGFIGAHFQDGKRILSGHWFDIPHKSAEARQDFIRMIQLQWGGMQILTYRGVTETEPEPEGPQAHGGGSGGSGGGGAGGGGGGKGQRKVSTSSPAHASGTHLGSTSTTAPISSPARPTPSTPHDIALRRSKRNVSSGSHAVGPSGGGSGSGNKK